MEVSEMNKPNSQIIIYQALEATCKNSLQVQKEGKA